jgi:hypothetical protein
MQQQKQKQQHVWHQQPVAAVAGLGHQQPQPTKLVRQVSPVSYLCRRVRFAVSAALSPAVTVPITGLVNYHCQLLRDMLLLPRHCCTSGSAIRI